VIALWGGAAAFPEARAGTRPRAQLAFTVARGDQELSPFGSELSRAVGEALEAAGVEVGPGGEHNVAGRLDALEGERVRLSALARGRTVFVEGPLETLDQLAAQLAGKLVPILDGDARGKELRPARDPKASPRPLAKIEVASSRPPPVRSEAVAAPSPPPAAKSPDPPPPPRLEPPKAEEKVHFPLIDAEPVQPYHNEQPWGGWVRGRVVAHAIVDWPHGYAGTGVVATQALYNFLSRRLRLAVVPTGSGLGTPQLAADEGWRASARHVVMARFESLEYLPGPLGMTVRCRLQIMVVREGRVVLRRVVDSPVSDPTRRGRDADPVYQSVTSALEGVFPELLPVLVEGR
jgi:hypothetical protein